MVLWDSRTVIACAHFANVVPDQFSDVSFRNSSGTLFTYDLDWSGREVQTAGDLVAVPFDSSESDADGSLTRAGTKFFTPWDEDFWSKADFGFGFPILLVDSQGKAARLWNVKATSHAANYGNHPITSSEDEGIGAKNMLVGSGDSGSPYYFFHPTHGWLYGGMYSTRGMSSPGYSNSQGGTFYEPLNALGATVGTSYDISEAASVVELETTAATFSPPAGLVRKKLTAKVAGINNAGTGDYLETPEVVPTISGAFAPYFDETDGLVAVSTWDGVPFIEKIWKVQLNFSAGVPGITYVQRAWYVNDVLIPGELETGWEDTGVPIHPLNNIGTTLPDGESYSAGDEIRLVCTIYNSVGSDTLELAATLREVVPATVGSLAVSPASPVEESDATLSWTATGDPAPEITINYLIDGTLEMDQPATITIPTGTAGTDNYNAYVTAEQCSVNVTVSGSPLTADIVT
tara:strand:+ start:8243 stop:9625 length:1383 start_codon:yes stop_codon:yes gene_type:complete